MIEKIQKMGRKIFQHKFIFLGIVLLLGSAIYYGYKQKTTSSEEEVIQTAVVEKGDISVLITGTGQVQAKNQVDLKGVVAGDGIDVKEVLVKNDQQVKKGDLIAVLDMTEPMKKVKNAQLELQTAQISFKETEKNNPNKTKEDKWARQKQEIAVSQKATALNDIYDDLKDYSIRAPFDGIITNLNVSAGDSISQSDVIASVITKELQAEISLNEVDAVKVKVGDDVKLTMDALPGVVMKGKISKMDTIGQVEQNVVSYKAEIEFENTSELLKPGMSVNAEITVDSRKNVLMVPNSAIKNNTEGKTYVQLVKGKSSQGNSEESLDIYEIKEQIIETGLTDDVVTEVVGGLKVGDQIVTKIVSSTQASKDKETSGGLLNSVHVPGMGGGGR